MAPKYQGGPKKKATATTKSRTSGKVIPGGSPGPTKKGPKKPQQELASRVKAAALKSGMSWTDWSETRKSLVGAYRTKGATKKSTATVKRATKLVRKSEGKKAAKSYSKAATKQDKKGAKRRIRQLDGRPNSSGGKPSPTYQGGPTRKKKK